jgi:hypothetical protein
LFCRKANADWAVTKYIIEQGGDVNFPIEWESSSYLGSGKNYGRAIDYAKDLEKQDMQNRKRNGPKNFPILFELLAQKVIQFSFSPTRKKSPKCQNYIKNLSF